MSEKELSPYQKKLRDPRWQKKRLEILEMDQWRCQRCKSSEKTLAVHHRVYFEKEDPWDLPNSALETLCEDCHEKETREGKGAEKHLIVTLRGLGVPWYALHVLAYEFQRCFPPLRTDDALTVIATIKASLPKISKAMGLEPQDGPLEE